MATKLEPPADEGDGSDVHADDARLPPLPRCTTSVPKSGSSRTRSGTPPHLDVLFAAENDVVAVESKCTEFVQDATHTRILPGYLRLAERGEFSY